MSLNLQFSCLSLQRARVTGVSHHNLLIFLIDTLMETEEILIKQMTD
jgi:hypothetical protein